MSRRVDGVELDAVALCDQKRRVVDETYARRRLTIVSDLERFRRRVRELYNLHRREAENRDMLSITRPLRYALLMIVQNAFWH